MKDIEGGICPAVLEFETCEKYYLTSLKHFLLYFPCDGDVCCHLHGSHRGHAQDKQDCIFCKFVLPRCLGDYELNSKVKYMVTKDTKPNKLICQRIIKFL